MGMAPTPKKGQFAESAQRRLRLPPHHHRRSTRPRGQVILQVLWGTLTSQPMAESTSTCRTDGALQLA